ncbi:uncharacterized protein LOC142336853 [Convolutriloba macropyga]|uniref:uncharacterized protein LOC142336853 n=1 Tax=Convolutriloba macropyga TaxID=536237 RepID=UPI003F51E1D0
MSKKSAAVVSAGKSGKSEEVFDVVSIKVPELKSNKKSKKNHSTAGTSKDGLEFNFSSEAIKPGSSNEAKHTGFKLRLAETAQNDAPQNKPTATTTTKGSYLAPLDRARPEKNDVSTGSDGAPDNERGGMSNYDYNWGVALKWLAFIRFLCWSCIIVFTIRFLILGYPNSDSTKRVADNLRGKQLKVRTGFRDNCPKFRDATIVCDTLAGSMTFGAGRCVRSSNEKLNYGGAEQFCNDASLKLISSDDITNFQELPQIRYSKKSRRYFTGLKRLPTADPNEVLFGSEDGKYVVTSDNDILAKAEGSISDGDIVCLNDRGAITEICLGYHIIYALCAYKF